MIFSQNDSNLLFYDRFYPSILESEKTSQELVTPVMAPSQKTGLSNYYFTNIIEIIQNNKLKFYYVIKVRIRFYNLLFIEEILFKK